MTTFPVQNFFPEFVDNQILNKTQLNQLRIYLDEQNRLTRVRLIGIGIVCGLQASVSGSVAERTITISEGYGVTSEGYLIEIPSINLVKKRNYNDPHTAENDFGQAQPVYEPWKVPDDEIDPLDPDPEWQIGIIELMSDTQLADLAFVEEPGNNTTDIHQDDFDGKVLVLYLEMNEDPLYSCLVTDCNNKGHNLEMNVRALLVDKEDLEPLLPCPRLGALIDIPRFYAGLYKTTGLMLSQVDTVDQINDAFQDIALHLKEELVDKLNTVYANCSGFLNLEAAGDSLSSLDATLTGVINSDERNQYVYDFLKDLAQGYNEFMKLLCHLLKDCCPEGTFPRHLMIRDFVEGDAEESARWRNKFKASPIRNVLWDDLAKAERMFHRIVTLADNYAWELQEEIKITPSESETHPLGSRALPHYYDYDDTNTEWQVEGCCAPPLLAYAINDMGLPTGNYLSNPNNPLNNQIRQKSFLKIEGHLGQDCFTVLDQLQLLKATHNLDFNVISLQLQSGTGDGAGSGLVEDPDILAIKDLLAENLSDRRAIERIIENLIPDNDDDNDGSYNETDELNVAEVLRDLIVRFGQIGNRKSQIVAAHNNWVNRRKQLVPPCDISHLETDYLLLRSETICIYDKLDALLSFLSVFDPVIDILETINAACVDFDDENSPEVGAFFNVGQEVTVEEQIAVTIIDPAEPLGGNGATIIEAMNDFGAGKALELYGVAARFDLTNLTFPRRFILAEIRTSPAEYIEIQINDSAIYQGTIEDLDSTDIATNTGFLVSTYFKDDGVYNGLLFIYGTEIESVAIAGNYLALDNICVLGSNNADLSFNPETFANGLSVERLEQRSDEIDVRVGEIQTIDLTTLTVVEREALTVELNSLEQEKNTLTQTISVLKVGDSVRGSFTSGNALFAKKATTRLGALKVRAAISYQSREPAVMIALSLVYGLVRLRQCIKQLIELLPKDIRCFNYCLFISTYKEIISIMIQVRLLVICVIELLVVGLASSDDDDDNEAAFRNSGKKVKSFLNDLDGNESVVLQLILSQIPKIQDVLTYWKKALHNCLHAKFATLYYTLEHTMLGAGDSWQQFMQKNTGAEHLTGVGHGDTFILACENSVGDDGLTQSTVVADFTVSGGIGCCCAIDPSNICLPPVALPNYEILAIIYNSNQNDEPLTARKNIKVINNDFGLNDHPNLQVILPSTTSALGAELTLVDSNNSITYVYESSELRYGLDTFEYILRDEDCGLEDVGHVMVMIKPVEIEIEEEPDTYRFQRTFEGTVVDELTGAPLQYVNVYLQDSDYATQTGPEGNFTLTSVFPGEYLLVAGINTHETREVNIIVDPDTVENPTLEIRLDPISDSTVGPYFTGTVYDNVTGQALELADVSLANTDILVQTDSNGVFNFDSVAPNAYQLLIIKEGYSRATRDIIVQDGSNNADVGIIRIDPIPGAGNVIIGQNNFFGIIEGETGEPLIGANVIITSVGTSFGTATDIDGRYNFNEISIGQHQLQATFAGYYLGIQNFTVDPESSNNDLGTLRLFSSSVSSAVDVNLIQKVAATTSKALGVSPGETVSKLEKVFSTRALDRKKLVDKVKSESVVTDQEAFVYAAIFMTKDLQNSKISKADLAKQYEKLITMITKAFKSANSKEQTAYRRTIEAVTHAYLDKLTLLDPEKLDKRSEKAIYNAGKKLTAVKISSTNLYKKWKGSTLKKDFKFAVIDQIGRAMKKK